MTVYTASEARTNLYKLIDYVADSHEPVIVTGKRNSIVMISEEDFRAMQETLHILSVPGMKDSIIEGQNTDLGECSDTLDW